MQETGQGGEPGADKEHTVSLESRNRLDDEETEDRTKNSHYSVTFQEETAEGLRNQTQDNDFVSLSDWKMDED